MAGWSALVGTAITFAGAYWLEKTRGADWLRPLIRFQAMLPMAVPGMVLGIAYIFFFNHPSNPLNWIYGTTAILVASVRTAKRRADYRPKAPGSKGKRSGSSHPRAEGCWQ
jgi:ABC-type Fe3+ transport system permease subunit